MSYSSNAMLNASVKKAHPSEEARTVFRNAYNTAFGNKMKESTCFAIAHSAANKITKKSVHEDTTTKQKRRRWMIQVNTDKHVYDGPSKKRTSIIGETMNYIQEVTDAYLRKHVASAVKRSAIADVERDTTTTGKVYKFLTKSRTAKRLGFTPDKASQDQNPRDMRFRKVDNKLVRESAELLAEGRRKIKPKEDWHKNDPDALLAHVYWLHGRTPPTNHAVKLSAYESIVKQLNKQNPCEDPKVLDKHLNHFRKAAKKSMMGESIDDLVEARTVKAGSISSFLKGRAAQSKADKEAKRQAQFQGRMAKMSAPKKASAPAPKKAKVELSALKKGEAPPTPSGNAKYAMTPEIHNQVRKDIARHKENRGVRTERLLASAKREFRQDDDTSKRIHKAKTSQPAFKKKDFDWPVDDRVSYTHLRGVAKMKSETAMTGEGNRRQHIEASAAHKAAGAHPDAPSDHTHISMAAKHIDYAKKAPKATKVKIDKAVTSAPSNERRNRYAASLARKDHESDEETKKMFEGTGYYVGQKASDMNKYRGQTMPEDRVRVSKTSRPGLALEILRRRKQLKDNPPKKTSKKIFPKNLFDESHLKEAKHLLTLRAGGDLPFTKKSLVDSGGELHHHGPNGEAVYSFNSYDKLQHFRAVSRHRNRDPDAIRNKEYIDIQHEDDKAVDESLVYSHLAQLAQDATKHAHSTNDKIDHFKAAYFHSKAAHDSPDAETLQMHQHSVEHHNKRSIITEEVIIERKKFWLPKGGEKIVKKRPANMPMRPAHAVERADIKALHTVVSEANSVRRPGGTKPAKPSLGALGQSFGSGTKDDKDALKNQPTGGLSVSHHDKGIRDIMAAPPARHVDSSDHGNWARNTVEKIHPGTHIQLGHHERSSHGEYVGKHPREAGKHIFKDDKGERYAFHPTSVTHIDGKEVKNPHPAPQVSRTSQTEKSTLDRDWKSKK